MTKDDGIYVYIDKHELEYVNPRDNVRIVTNYKCQKYLFRNVKVKNKGEKSDGQHS